MKLFAMAHRAYGLVRRIPNSFLALVIPAVAASISYYLTLAPGVVGYDSAELVTGSYTLGIVHPTGYPFYLLLGKLFTYLPIRSVAFRVNLLSAVLAVLSVLLLCCLIYKITGSILASWAGGLFLAFAHTFWQMGTVAEVYTLHTALLGLTLLMVLRWSESPSPRRLYMLAFVFGLSMTNHVSSVFLLPMIVWFVWRQAGWRASFKLLPGAAIAFILGLSPYLYFPIRFAADPPLNYVRTYYDIDLTTPGGIWWMVSGQAYRFFAFGYSLSQYLLELKSALVLFVQNYTVVGFMIGMLGIPIMVRRKRPLSVLLLALFAVNVAFFAGYAVIDKETMFLPALYLWAFFIGVGAWGLKQLIGKLEWLSFQERRVVGASLAAAVFTVIVLTGRAHWSWADMSDAYGPEIFAHRVLATVPEDSMIIGRWSTAVILEYYQHVEGYRPDLVIFNRSRYEVASYYHYWKDGVPYDEALTGILQAEEGLLRILGDQRSLFDAEYDPYFARTYEYKPVGNLFKMVLKSNTNDG
jgi:hypothetical protein